MTPSGTDGKRPAVESGKQFNLLVLNTSGKDAQRVISAVFVRREARWRVAPPSLVGTSQRVEQSGLLAVHTVGVRSWREGRGPRNQELSAAMDAGWWTLPAHAPLPDDLDLAVAERVARVLPLIVVLTGAKATPAGTIDHEAVRRARWIDSLHLPFAGPTLLTNAVAGYPKPGPVHGIVELRAATLTVASEASAPLVEADRRSSMRAAPAAAAAWLQHQARRLRHASEESRALLDEWWRR